MEKLALPCCPQRIDTEGKIKKTYIQLDIGKLLKKEEE